MTFVLLNLKWVLSKIAGMDDLVVKIISVKLVLLLRSSFLRVILFGAFE